MNLDQALDFLRGNAYAAGNGCGLSSPTNLTIEELCAMNLKRALQENSRTAHRSYRCHSDLFIHKWGNLLASQLTRAEIQSWAKEQLTQSAPATVKHQVGFLSKAYNMAIDMGILATNPAVRVKTGRSRARHQWLDKRQELAMRDAYLKIFGAMGDLWWKAERFAILTGVRLGEQAHLQPRHIRPTILTVPDEGKTGSRLVPLHPEAYQIAQEWMDFSREHFDSAWVFWPVAGDRNNVGVRWSVDVWNQARQPAGLADFQRKDLRRTFGSRLVQAGEPIYSVMKLLGHSTPNMTMRYCQVDLMHLSDGVMRLD